MQWNHMMQDITANRRQNLLWDTWLWYAARSPLPQQHWEFHRIGKISRLGRASDRMHHGVGFRLIIMRTENSNVQAIG